MPLMAIPPEISPEVAKQRYWYRYGERDVFLLAKYGIFNCKPIDEVVDKFIDDTEKIPHNFSPRLCRGPHVDPEEQDLCIRASALLGETNAHTRIDSEHNLDLYALGKICIFSIAQYIDHNTEKHGANRNDQLQKLTELLWSRDFESMARVNAETKQALFCEKFDVGDVLDRVVDELKRIQNVDEYKVEEKTIREAHIARVNFDAELKTILEGYEIGWELGVDLCGEDENDNENGEDEEQGQEKEQNISKNQRAPLKRAIKESENEQNGQKSRKLKKLNAIEHMEQNVEEEHVLVHFTLMPPNLIKGGSPSSTDFPNLLRPTAQLRFFTDSLPGWVDQIKQSTNSL